MSDSYVEAVEFYDLMAAPYWSRTDALMPELLSDVDTLAGPVVDVGAGTGLSTVSIAEALPEASIIAVEPSAAMRAVLMSRLAARRDLRERVTVLPGDFLDVDLTPPCSAVVVLGTIGHFDSGARQRVWAAIAAGLAPGATALVEVQKPGRVEAAPRQRYTQAHAGSLRYEGWSEARPVDGESLIWRMTYHVYRGERLIRSTTAEHRLWPVDAVGLTAEADAAGLVVIGGAGGILRFVKPTPRREGEPA